MDSFSLIFLLADLLVVLLGHEDFRVREQAMNALRSSEPVLALEKGLLHPDLEVRKRCSILVEDYYSVLPSNYPTLPYIDMLPKDLPGSEADQKTFLDQARALMGTDSTSFDTDWPDYRYATSLYTIELRKRGWSKKQVRGLLDQMAEIEDAYRTRCGHLPIVRINR